jgi:putative ABC transport system ATP-binding protein
MTARLQLDDLSKSYPGAAGTLKAVDSVSLSAAAGQFVAVRGPSGCGKTTLILAAGLLLRPTSGRVLLDGQDPYALSSDRRARLRAANIGFVFQQFHLIPFLSVLDNVLAPVLAGPVTEAHERACELLAHFGLQHRARHLAADLSTGERQRAALARAMLARPKLLLADEPTANLDEENRNVVLCRLAEFARGGGTVLLVTHDSRAAQCADLVLDMQDGKIRDTPPVARQQVGMHEG